jgi:CBS domain-containing protein
MLDHDCGIIPVCKDSRLVGVITDRDITCRAVAKGMYPAAVPIRDVMTKTLYTIHQDEEVDAAIQLMEAKQVRRLPVVDDNGHVIGIVAPSDLAPTFASTNVADFLLAVSYWSRRPAAAQAVS